MMQLIEEILTEKPAFHRSETEVTRTFDPSESYLPQGSVLGKLVNARSMACYGIESEVIRYLATSVSTGDRTLETGAGLTTLVFAIQGAEHTSITPNKEEIAAIRDYAGQKRIDLKTVEFITESSDYYLPRCATSSLDLVLLDGKHAFPWPIVDWFYTADRLKEGGRLIVDDVGLRSVSILREFLEKDPRWKLLHNFGDKTLVFGKVVALVHDVAWHMQPWTVQASPSSDDRQNLASRIYRRVKRALVRSRKRSG